MRNCWEIKGCPASHYIRCSAYTQKVDCWQLEDGCLCASFDGCKDCIIYKEHLSEKTAESE